ncbi:MAG: BrnT family toxin [Aridibacter sp.]
MRYNWNSEKAKKVKKNHKVDFEKIKDIFDDPFAVEFIDEEHSADDEIRFAIIGLTAEYGLIYLVFTEISFTHLHFITARKAENWMIKEYGQNRSRT